ncbi:hypothetical protein LPJ66_000689 [Kickxella alabastrina]|uniref:Uncharacterized protein n=1 Tax=Kickxella alabastrina TaxID=61397 RepID=A0ACC1IVC3_9FUNG|nr:hypothetical protein LPJ66_000689 [Kickxella alabastrina]
MGNHLSFTFTESELMRPIIAEDMNVSLDPRGKADAIMVVVIATVYAFNSLAVIYMLWHRNYPPLKSKNVIIMALIFVVSVVWYVGDLQANGHIPLANSGLTNCKAYGLWMRILLGACGMCSLIALRAYGLYRVFILNLPYHSLGLYAPFALYWLGALVVGLISQLLDPKITTEFLEPLDLCDFHSGFKGALYGFIWSTVFLVAFAHWKIRNIKSSFNESREMLITCLIISGVLLYATIMNYMRPMYPLDVRLRIINTSLDHLAANSMWWLIMGVPLYKCLFNRSLYLELWINKLRRDGLQREYNVDSNPMSTNAHSSLLVITTAGGTNAANFYKMDDNVYESKDFNPKDYAHASIPKSIESTMLPNDADNNNQVTQSPTADGRFHKVMPTDTVNDSPISYNLCADSVSPNIRSGSSKTASRLYTPISFPEETLQAPIKLSDAYNRHLDYVGSPERHLV